MCTCHRSRPHPNPRTDERMGQSREGMRSSCRYPVRKPNPPSIVIEHLTPDQRRRVVLLALQVVYALGEGKDYSAYEIIDFANIEQDEVLYTALWSLLSSDQRRRIKSESELAHAQR